MDMPNLLLARQQRSDQLGELLTRLKQQSVDILPIIDNQDDPEGEVVGHLHSILGSLTMNAICIETMMSYGEAFEERNRKLIEEAADFSAKVDETIFKEKVHGPEKTS